MKTNINYTNSLTNSIGLLTPIDEIISTIKSPDNNIIKIINVLRSGCSNPADIKKKLPAFWLGNFKDNKRKSENFISTDLMIFDFDKLENVLDVKQRIIDKLKPLVCFISPSGNGIKMIIELTDEITNIETYRLTYDTYKDKFNEKGLKADNTSDPTRLCFMSMDSEIHYNQNCNKYSICNTRCDTTYNTTNDSLVNKSKHMNENRDTPRIQWVDDDQTVLDLLDIIKQNGRPDYIDWKKILFGLVDKAGKNKAIELMQQYFPEEQSGEYEKAFKNPLTNIHFGSLFYYANINAKDYYKSKYFTDTKTKSIIEQSETKQEKSIDKQNIEWWFRSDKGRYVISYSKLFGFLSDSGFGKIYIRKPDKIMLVRRVDNIIYKTSPKEIRDYIKNYINNIDDKSVSFDLINVFHSPKGIISDSQMETLDNIEIDNLRDLDNTAYFFYENAFVEITKDTCEVKSYKELKKPIWSDSIIKRKIDIIDNDIDIYKYLDFYQFIRNINNDEEKYIKRWECAMGYMLHRHKTKAITKAVVLTDREYAEEADGRTGKSLSATCLKFIRNVVTPEGRGLRSDSPFMFQSVELDTDILFINDADEHLDFTRFYNPISDDWQVEKKNQGAIIIPFETSPKVIITTNYAVGDSGGSSKDRKYEVALFKFYNDTKKPETEFKRRFFEDYDEYDWLMFDYYMIHCMQQYLIFGLPSIEDNDLSVTGLKYRLGKSVYDFCTDNISGETGDFQNAEMYQKYLDESGLTQRNISQSRLTRNVKTYLKENEYYINETKVRGRQGIRYWKKHF